MIQIWFDDLKQSQPFLVEIMCKTTFAVTWERIKETSLGKEATVSKAQRAPLAFSYKANEELDMTMAQVVYSGGPIFQLDKGACGPSNQNLSHHDPELRGGWVVLLLM